MKMMTGWVIEMHISANLQKYALALAELAGNSKFLYKKNYRKLYL